jgi:hypothetical protein
MNIKWLMLFVVAVIIVCLFPLLFTSQCSSIDFTGTGQIGDTIGGTMGPFVAIIAAALTYVAFMVQYKANKQQRDDIAVERFTNHVQQLINIYRDMVNNMYLYKSNIKGQPSFHFIFYEFKSIYRYISRQVIGYEYKTKKVSNELKSAIEYIAFEIFLSGLIQKNTTQKGKYANGKLNIRIRETIENEAAKETIENKADIVDLIEKIKKEELLEKIEDGLIDIRDNYQKNRCIIIGGDAKDKKIEGFPDSRYEIDEIRQLYKGNLPRLSSFFNHFYNILDYLAEKEIENVKKEKDNSIKKMLICQMGVHEIGITKAYYSFKSYITETKEKNEKIYEYINEMEKEMINNYKDTFIWDSPNFLKDDV